MLGGRRPARFDFPPLASELELIGFRSDAIIPGRLLNREAVSLGSSVAVPWKPAVPNPWRSGVTHGWPGVSEPGAHGRRMRL
jgi:hypothetical protein